MKIIQFISFTLIAAGLLFGGASSAFADFKLYAASECERWDENFDPATYLSSSRRYNPSTSRNLRLDCPSIRDRGANSIRSSWIRVIDRNPTDEVCARMVAYRQAGNSAIQRNGSAQCTGVGFNSTRAVFLNTGGLRGLTKDMHYYHSVYNVPKRYIGRDSGVVTYSVNEPNAAD